MIFPFNVIINTFRYVDYLTVMSYDFHFGSEPKIAHQGAYSETVNCYIFLMHLIILDCCNEHLESKGNA